MKRGQPASDLRFESRAAFVAALLLFVAYVATCFGSAEEPRWRATYFADDAFTGASLVRWEEALRFHWGRGSPDPAVPRDHFSARFETCLVLPSATRVAFLLTSDDDAFLDVDGERVLGLPGVHRLRSKGVELDLGAGTHTLRVDYAESSGDAAVGLSASLDGHAPRSIPNDVLMRPGPDGCREGQ
jgi:hypothetical protein